MHRKLVVRKFNINDMAVASFLGSKGAKGYLGFFSGQSFVLVFFVW
jgi:hypothetical protein